SLHLSITISTATLLLLPLQAQAAPFFQSLWPGRSDDADLGRPPSRRGGGGRTENAGGTMDIDPCLRSLIALEPGETVIATQATADGDICPTSVADVAFTAEAQPFIWVYFPEYGDYDESGLPIEIALLDDQRPVERWQITLLDPAGVMCFQVPYELETNNIYAWSLEAQLTDSPAANPTVGGLLEYRPTVEDSWKDQLTAVGKQLITSPAATQQAQWQSLLQTQGLAAIVDVLPTQGCQTLLVSDSAPAPETSAETDAAGAL
ncbi:MAG: DUF928 domain-containing protein, partial [Leptolyngbya sp. SIO4C1]|nr:DUF928 domain-containing protein [Leptolyngbya sp. SIO4C1]